MRKLLWELQCSMRREVKHFKPKMWLNRAVNNQKAAALNCLSHILLYPLRIPLSSLKAWYYIVFQYYFLHPLHVCSMCGMKFVATLLLLSKRRVMHSLIITYYHINWGGSTSPSSTETRKEVRKLNDRDELYTIHTLQCLRGYKWNV